ADAFFDEFSCQKTVVGKGLFAGLCAVELMDMGRLIVDVHDFWDFDLHPVGHFVLVDSGEDLGVSEGFKIFFVYLIDGRNDILFQVSGYPAWILEVQYPISFGSALYSLIDGRQKAGTPDAFSCIGSLAARGQDYKSRKVVVFRPQPIGHPAAQAWPPQSW